VYKIFQETTRFEEALQDPRGRPSKEVEEGSKTIVETTTKGGKAETEIGQQEGYWCPNR
jgi:hypothetical protein